MPCPACSRRVSTTARSNTSSGESTGCCRHGLRVNEHVHVVLAVISREFWIRSICDISDATWKERNFPVRMVAAGGGDDFSRSTMKYLNELREKGGVMICVCTEHYAEKTKSPFSSFHELKYAQDYCLDVLPLKVADKFPPEPPSGPQHPYDKDGDAPAVISMVFRPNVVFTDPSIPSRRLSFFSISGRCIRRR